MRSRLFGSDGEAVSSTRTGAAPVDAATAAAEISRKSTADVPEPRRLEYWQCIVGEHVGSVELRDYDAENFSSGFVLSAIGDLKIGHFTGVSQTLERKAELIRSSDTDDYIVVLESDNTFVFEQNGRQRSGRGGMVLIDTARPYYSRHPESLDVVDIFIPRRVLEHALGPARLAAGLAIDATQPSFPVIVAFLRSLSEHGANLDPASAARMASIAVELIAASFGERLGRAPPRDATSAAILFRAQAYIADNLGVSGLGMQEVAATLGISVRRLHQVAADEGLSLVDWMWERRLLRARAMLGDPMNKARSVGSIAYDCGFVDQAHFSRRFKLRFGLAPSEARGSPSSAGAAHRKPPNLNLAPS